MAAAYKKYVLVCLIHAGQLLPLPKFTSSCVRHVIDSEGRPYNDLATAYCTRNAARLRRVAEQHMDHFGVVRQGAGFRGSRQVLGGEGILASPLVSDITNS